MAFKLFMLCLCLLVVTVSASSLYKHGPEKKDSVAKYASKMSDNETDYDEQVEVDKEKETETSHVAKTSPQRDSGDVIYDFIKNVSMILVTEAKACFLTKSTFDVPKPAELLQLLDLVTRDRYGIKVAPRNKVKLKVVSILEDRSDLSDEMANMCAKFPIYEVAEGDEDQGSFNQATEVVKLPVLDQSPAISTELPTVREWVCGNVCSMVCKIECNFICTNWGVCSWACKPWEVCNPVCNRVCNWFWRQVNE